MTLTPFRAGTQVVVTQAGANHNYRNEWIAYDFVNQGGDPTIVSTTNGTVHRISTSGYNGG
jgi:hypothetical protein